MIDRPPPIRRESAADFIPTSRLECKMQHPFLDPDEFWEAAKPLLDLLGVDPRTLYSEPGFTLSFSGGDAEIHYVKSASPNEPTEPWTLVRVGDDPECQEWGYDVRQHVPGAGDVMLERWTGSTPDVAPTRRNLPVRVSPVHGDIHLTTLDYRRFADALERERHDPERKP